MRLAHQTSGLIEAAAFTAMPAGAFLVNAARGGLIDYRALHDALAKGHLGGVGLGRFLDRTNSPG